MANHKSAKKRIRTNAKKRDINKSSLSKLKTMTKKAFDATDKAEIAASYTEAVSYLDKMASKGRIHKNTAARKKSQLTLHKTKIEAAG